METGTRIGKYVVEARLGEGGNGTVYAARDSVLGRRVAIKVLHTSLVYDASIAARFRQEAQAMAQLNHPNVVIVHDFIGEANHWAIVMEIVEHGETLGTVIKRDQRLEPRRALELIGQVGAGLGHAHARGIVHRDVKPANIMVIRDGARETAKITDFGIARIVDGERRTQAQLTLGTLWYIAPEQAQSSGVDSRADVYSLGCTLYEALTGRVVYPYQSPARVLAAHISEAPLPPSALVPGLPAPLEALVLRMLAKRPEDRPRDGEAVRALALEVERSLASVPRTLGAIHTTAAPGTSTGPLDPSAGAPSTAPHAAGAPLRDLALAPTLAATPSFPQAALGVTPRPPGAREEEDRRFGLWIGFGGLALISLTCLAGSFLCVLTGILR